MGIPARVLAKMATIGLSPEQAEAVAQMLADVEDTTKAENDALMEAARAKGRERWHRWDEKRRTNVSKREPTPADNSRDRVAHVEDKPLTTDTPPQKKELTPRAALEAVLDAEHVDAVIQHRQKLRKALTGHAAKLLAAKFAQCPDPNAAADTMIGNGWQGFEPDWITRPTARGSPAKSGGIGGAMNAINGRLENGQADSDRSDGTPGAVVLSLPYRSTS